MTAFYFVYIIEIILFKSAYNSLFLKSTLNIKLFENIRGLNKMLNTYGICAVNNKTFNQRFSSEATYSQEKRNAVVTCLKVHNLTLNILGYIPVVSTVSGFMRIGTGALMVSNIALREDKDGVI